MVPKKRWISTMVLQRNRPNHQCFIQNSSVSIVLAGVSAAAAAELAGAGDNVRCSEILNGNARNTWRLPLNILGSSIDSSGDLSKSGVGEGCPVVMAGGDGQVFTECQLVFEFAIESAEMIENSPLKNDDFLLKYGQVYCDFSIENHYVSTGSHHFATENHHFLIENHHVQWKIIIFSGGFSTISAFSIGDSNNKCHLPHIIRQQVSFVGRSSTSAWLRREATTVLSSKLQHYRPYFNRKSFSSAQHS